MPLSHESDEQVLERVRQHDENALKQLLSRYQNLLGDFSFSVVRCRGLADEAVANVFLNIWRGREKLVIRNTVRSYLFSAASNQSITLWKQRRKHDAVALDDVHPRLLIDDRGTDTDLLYQEFVDAIQALLSQLPAQRQLIFRMNRLEGMSYRQIAETLGLSERTVQNHMVQATRQLLHEWPKLRSSFGPRTRS